MAPPATRYITRHKTRQVTVIEAEATEVDVWILIFTSLSVVNAFLPAGQENSYFCRSVSLAVHIQVQNMTPHTDTSEIKGQLSKTTIAYDYLVVAVGAETQTFGIKGVKEHACFMKELHDAERVRSIQI